jgi:hypothetical protein
VRAHGVAGAWDVVVEYGFQDVDMLVGEFLRGVRLVESEAAGAVEIPLGGYDCRPGAFVVAEP